MNQLTVAQQAQQRNRRADGRYAESVLADPGQIGLGGAAVEPGGPANPPQGFRECFAYANISGMELTLSQAAKISGQTTRRLQQAVAAGDLPLHGITGRTQTIEATIFQAWTRAQAHGRRWEDSMRLAAISLLEGGGAAALTSPRRSELRSALKALNTAEIAHRLGATRGWFRYRSATGTPDEIATAVMPTGVSGLTRNLSARLLMSPDQRQLYGRTNNLERIEAEFGLIVDDEGDIFLADNTRTGSGELAVLVDLYLFGDTRSSRASAAEIERRAAEC